MPANFCRGTVVSSQQGAAQAAGGAIRNAYALLAREQFASGIVYGILVAAATMVSASHGMLTLAQVVAAVL
jgi:hypothetical protein